MKLKRNVLCPCGSGKKYKKCCLLDPEKNIEALRAAKKVASIQEASEILSEPIPIYQIRVTLIRMMGEHMETKISRTFDIPCNLTLYNLHMAIQNGFNWDNDHLFSFYMNGKIFDRSCEYSANPLGDHMKSVHKQDKSASAAQLRDLDLQKGSSFAYLFDYGDELVHDVKVLKIRESNDQDKKSPVLVDSVGTPPSQYGDCEDY